MENFRVIMNQRLSSFTFCLSLRHSFSSPVREQSIHKWAQMIHPTFTRQAPPSRIEICLNLFSFEKVLNICTSKTLSEDAKPWPCRIYTEGSPAAVGFPCSSSAQPVLNASL